MSTNASPRFFIYILFCGSDGRLRFGSRLAVRDSALRVAYNATIFTVYGAIERGFVGIWDKHLR